jgi:hypothetical protein
MILLQKSTFSNNATLVDRSESFEKSESETLAKFVRIAFYKKTIMVINAVMMKKLIDDCEVKLLLLKS